jgi:hypothetical protein
MTTLQAVQRRARWADLAVVALVVAALVGGWILREAVLSRATPFTVADVSGRYPAGWTRETGENPLLRVRDPRGGETGAALELRVRALAAEASPALALDALTLERSGQTTAYQTLSTDQVTVGGKAATSRTFTYVSVSRNPYLERLPVVMKGVDLALGGDGRVVIVTFVDSVDDFDVSYRHFLAFVQSLEF